MGTTVDMDSSMNSLQFQVPTDTECLMAGIVDQSYQTFMYGLVTSYRGEGIIKLPNGATWKVRGVSSSGEGYLKEMGFIEKIQII